MKIGKFVLVTGMGHCGTQWIAEVLNIPEQGVAFTHELKYGLGNWRVLLPLEEKHGISGRYQPYWEQIRLLLRENRFVGDSGSWVTTRIPEVDKIIKVDRTIYLLRNGVQQIHSWTPPWWNPPGDWWYNGYVKYRWELLGKPFGSWDKMSDWEKLCFWWWASVELVDWLQAWMGNVDVFRFEDLIQDTTVLSRLVDSFGLQMPDETLRAWQKTDVNRKVKGERRVSAVWGNWSRQQRKDFLRMCGPKMIELGYEMP